MILVFGYRLLNVRGIHELISSRDEKGKSSFSPFDRKGIHVLNKQLSIDSLTPAHVQISSDEPLDGKGKSSLSSFNRKGIHVLNKRLSIDSLTPTHVQISSHGTPNSV